MRNFLRLREVVKLVFANRIDLDITLRYTYSAQNQVYLIFILVL